MDIDRDRQSGVSMSGAQAQEMGSGSEASESTARSLSRNELEMRTDVEPKNDLEISRNLLCCDAQIMSTGGKNTGQTPPPAAAAAFIASLGSTLYGSFVEWIPVASGLIILLPGLALVDAVDELAHGQLTSGASRLAGVGSVLLAMAFGAVLGSAMQQSTQYEALLEVAAPGPTWWIGVALILVAVGSTIRFRARWSDFWAALLGSTLAIVGSRLGAENLGALVGPFIASFLLGLGANIYGLSFRQPAQMVTVPGLALLVPGSFGVRSMAALLTEDTAVGVDTAFRMFLTAMALVAGLLISNSLFREKSA